MILPAGNAPMIKALKHEQGDLSNFTGGATPLLDEPG
jgi:hypothetical protein